MGAGYWFDPRTKQSWAVGSVARDYFGATEMPLPFDESAFQETVRKHWRYYSPCEQVHWTSAQQEHDGSWLIATAPVFQEIYGGEEDGKRVWSGFEVDLFALSKDAGVEFKDFVAFSRSEGHCPVPFVRIKGEYFSQPFVLLIHLEPLPHSATKELLDVMRQEVRAIENRKKQ